MGRPDVRPVTSKVTRALEATPDEPTAAHTRFSILAIQLGRCPRYNQRLKSVGVTKATVPPLSFSLTAHAQSISERLGHMPPASQPTDEPPYGSWTLPSSSSGKCGFHATSQG